MEGRGVGALGSAVVGMHVPPSLDMSDRALDHVANLIDRGVELFLPVEELPARLVCGTGW